jgi:hypothetical protein
LLLQNYGAATIAQGRAESFCGMEKKTGRNPVLDAGPFAAYPDIKAFQ